MIDDAHSRLRKMERELYAVDIAPPNKRSALHDTHIETPDDWNAPTAHATTPMSKKIITPVFFRNMFLGSLGFLAIAILFFSFNLFFGNNSISANNVDITITTKSFVDGGELLPINVEVVNRNKLALELATLVLEYPEGSDTDTGTMARIARDIGTIEVGDAHQESYTVQLYGEEGSQKNITAHIEFRVKGSNVVYDKDENTELTIRTSPIRFTLDMPESVIPNQVVPLKFTIIGNGTATLPDTAVILQYPDGFIFNRADPAPSFGNMVWYLGDVPPGVNRTIMVYGSFSGSASEAKTIRASVGAQDSRNEQTLTTTYNSLAQVVPLTNAFLSASIKVGQQTAATIPVNANEQLSISIPWENTLTSQITNAQITVRLSGSAYDPARVQAVNGFFDTVNNKIIWNKQQDSNLGSIDPGKKGELSFSMMPKQFGGGTSVANPSITITVDIEGIPAGGQKLSATSIDTKKLVINSDLNLLAKTIHYSGFIQNGGPMPPVPNKETTYTLDWQITNFRNRVTNVAVSTTLPLWVKWKDVVVPQSEITNVTYNSVTRTLVWNVGDVPAGTGSTSPAKSLALKIGFTPSNNQVGAIPALTGEITITGRDEFTKTDLSFTKRPMNTMLLNDGGGPGATGIVAGQ